MGLHADDATSGTFCEDVDDLRYQKGFRRKAEQDPRRLRPRDILPLPLASVPEVRPNQLSRVVRKRLGRNQAIADRVNESVVALNQLGGCAESSHLPPFAAQTQCLDHLHDVIRSCPPPADRMQAEEAVNELLGQGRAYDGDGASTLLAPYDPELASVPQVGAVPVELASQLPEPARSCLVRF